jgi:spermidine/putrescine transport system ATP-binding protein
MRGELAQLQKTVGVTFLFVTHDQEEALAMSSRCAVMNEGVLEQVASPRDLYRQPASRFVADFIGQVNLFAGHMAHAPDGALGFLSSEFAGPIPVETPQPLGEGPVWMAVRPENIDLSTQPFPLAAAAGEVRIAGTVSRVSYLGSHSALEVLVGGRTLRVLCANRGSDGLAMGAEVWLSWRADVARILDR